MKFRFFKKSFFLLKGILLSLFILFSFSSCEMLLSFLGFETEDTSANAYLPRFTVSPGDGFAIMSWYINYDSSGSSQSSISAEVTFTITADGNEIDSFSVMSKSGTSSKIVSGLTNGQKYVFKAECNSESIKRTVIPSKEGTEVFDAGEYKTKPIQVSSDTNIVTIKNIDSPLTFTYALRNPSDQEIPLSNIRTLVSQNSGESVNLSSSLSSRSAIAEEEECEENSGFECIEENNGEVKIRHFTPSSRMYSALSSRASYSLYDTYSSVSSAATGQTKTLWLDNNSSLSEFKENEVTLRAIGKNSDNSPIVFVWVEDGCYTTDSFSSGKKINTKLAEKIAEKFSDYYYKEKAVFGDEAEGLIPFGKGASYLKDNSSVKGDTDGVVNIVVYDIGADYSLSSQDQCGVVGYFFAKDYYQKNSSYPSSASQYYSNEGKYFYVDSAFCNSNSTAKNITNSPSETSVTTLFHEFQHMINYNQKNVKAKISSVSSWYNEMLSMLAEDLMMDSLNLSSDQAPMGERSPTFNRYYYYSGLTEYRSDSYSITSYGTAYTFGAWLARNYGGGNLIKEISQNSYTDMASIIAAISEINGVEKTEDELVHEFMNGVLYRPSYVDSNADFTGTHYNQGTLSSSFTSLEDGDFEWTLEPYSIYSELGKYESSSRGYEYGPLTGSSSAMMALRPSNGLLFRKIGDYGTSSSNQSITLVFSPAEKGEELFIYIQDQFKSGTKDVLSSGMNPLY